MSSPSDISVDIEDVSKSFGTVRALDGVSLQIMRGERFAIMGADGSGRTTLFRLMASLLFPDSGKISVEGYDTVRDYRELRQCIGYMPGKFSLYGDLSVSENLAFFASLYGIRPEQNRYLVDDIYSQIEPFKDRMAAKLSGGMKQKLALCCALIHAPKVLFLDEPTTGVDPVSRQDLWQMLSRLSGQGITIVASTPYLDEVRKCDRAALLERGRVKSIGSPEEIAALFEGGLKKRPVDASSESIISVKGLTKKFGDFTAVDDISFEVRKGEIFGFLGANGAGKTTAMRILCGLSIPTSGTGMVAGYSVDTQSEEIKKHIGYMSQKFSLYDNLTVAENMRLFAGIYGVPDAEIPSRIDNLLEELDFKEERDRMVKTLPPGWKQRLAFSVSMIHRPEVVFLDEPTGGVDPIARQNLWKMIYRVADSGTTIFVTTHYMDEAEYCDRISIMVDGRIEAMGTPAGLKKEYGADNLDEVFHMLAKRAKRGGSDE
jgi:ABC-2 type transport system ATP-binding protein